MADRAWKTSTQPLLCCSVKTAQQDHELIVESADEVYTFSGPSARLLSSLLPQLDGEKRIDFLSNNLQIDPQVIAAHLEPIAADGLILDATAITSAPTSEEFVAAYTRECHFRARQIFIQPFWTTLLTGAAPLSLIIGWGIEFYHYVEAANEHMAAAVAHCRQDPKLRRWLAEHYAEEHNHSEIFLNGLAACGLDREQITRATPLASTRALINYLTELASSDTLAYTATFGVMQAEREQTTHSGVNQFYDRMIAGYPAAGALFEAIRKHALIDVDLDHQELILERICARKDRIQLFEAQRIVRAIVDTVEHFILFFEGIYDYYQKPGVIIPRPSLDIRTLG
jgi:pyrroloquinoline quinone (PQQ) biosynthesis protein C